jgi:hypothetical protein
MRWLVAYYLFGHVSDCYAEDTPDKLELDREALEKGTMNCAHAFVVYIGAVGHSHTLTQAVDQPKAVEELESMIRSFGEGGKDAASWESRRSNVRKACKLPTDSPGLEPVTIKFMSKPAAELLMTFLVDRTNNPGRTGGTKEQLFQIYTKAIVHFITKESIDFARVLYNANSKGWADTLECNFPPTSFPENGVYGHEVEGNAWGGMYRVIQQGVQCNWEDGKAAKNRQYSPSKDADFTLKHFYEARRADSEAAKAAAYAKQLQEFVDRMNKVAQTMVGIGIQGVHAGVAVHVLNTYIDLLQRTMGHMQYIADESVRTKAAIKEVMDRVRIVTGVPSK